MAAIHLNSWSEQTRKHNYIYKLKDDEWHPSS